MTTCTQQWTNCQGRWAPAQVSLCDWGRPSSPRLPFSLRASAFEFFSYTALRYLVTVMGLVIPWSLTLLVVDAYSLFIKCLPHQRSIIITIFLGDMVLSYLSLAAACSTAGVTDLLQEAGGSFCSGPAELCDEFRLPTVMAFLSWFLLSASCLTNFWLLPSL